MRAFIYQETDTPVHRLSPVAKTVTLVSLFSVSMVFNHPVYLFGLLAAVVFLGAISRTLAAMWNIKILLLLLFIFPTCLWSVYLSGSTVVYTLGPIDISIEGLLYGLSMGLRLSGMLMAGLILLGSTRTEDFTAGLTRMGIPYRMSFALTLAFRLVPLFFSTYQIITQAQQSRGFAIHSGSLLKRIRKTIPVLIPVFVSGIRRTDQLAIALESKGFGHVKQRTCLNPIRISRMDKITMIVSVLTVCSAIALRLAGYGKI